MLHALAATASFALVSLSLLIIALELIKNGGRIRSALAGDLGLPLVEINQLTSYSTAARTQSVLRQADSSLSQAA